MKKIIILLIIIGLGFYFFGGDNTEVNPTSETPAAEEIQDTTEEASTVEQEVEDLESSSATLDAEIDELESLDFE